MYIEVLKSKIHRVKVKQTELNYAGSITLDLNLIEAVDLIPGKKIQIVNNNNGERFETYVIEGERNSGVVCLNGAAARKAEVDDILIIISYCLLEKEKAKKHKAIVVFPDKDNKLNNTKTMQLKSPALSTAIYVESDSD